MGRCRSPCGGGTGLGRDQYPGGPWGRGGGRLAERGQDARAAGQVGGGPGRAVFRSAGFPGPVGWARVALLGWHVGGPDVVLPTNRARGTGGLCALGY